jgi:ABC-type transport system involved in multi-copper enzyme maturation permease subunit
MKGIVAALWAESLKVRKSKVFWLSLVFFVFVSGMMGLIMFVQIHPEISQKLGMIGTKASLLRFGEPSWQNYFTLSLQGIAGIGLVGYGFITSWIFGREYSDHTIKDVLSLPVTRTCIVLSKLIIVVFWCTILTCVFLLSGLIFGYFAGISGWSGDTVSQFLHTLTMISLLTILLCTPVAFLASYSGGFLLPVGFIILTMIMANFTGLVGLGPYFPWAIPGLLSVPQGHIKLISYLILGFTSILGIYGTIAWWRFADQK